MVILFIIEDVSKCAFEHDIVVLGACGNRDVEMVWIHCLTGNV